jgi:sirohydrochlorin cobaltochelatase
MAPVTDRPRAARQTAVLLAAHGERRENADNEGVLGLARDLTDRGLVPEVTAGFINGVPTIKDALDTLTADRIIVYPLFASSGYFTRDRLVQLIDEADRESRDIRILPPLGLDPGLPHLVVAFVKQIAREHGFAPQSCTVIFLAHGSRRNSASREATEHIACDVKSRAAFREVRIAFLEERPFLDEAAASLMGPAIIVGLFSGEGMHGAGDAPRLTAELGRNNVVFAGVIGNAPGIADVVARSVGEALLQDIRDRRLLCMP